MKQSFKLMCVSAVVNWVLTVRQALCCRKHRGEPLNSVWLFVPFSSRHCCAGSGPSQYILLSLFAHRDIFPSPAKPKYQCLLNSFGRLVHSQNRIQTVEHSQWLVFTLSICSHFELCSLPSLSSSPFLLQSQRDSFRCIACLSIYT